MKTQILTLAFGAICLITTSVVLADGDKCVFQGNILTPDQIEKNVQTLVLACCEINVTVKINFLPNRGFDKQPRLVHAKIRMGREAVRTRVEKHHPAFAADVYFAQVEARPRRR